MYIFVWAAIQKMRYLGDSLGIRTPRYVSWGQGVRILYETASSVHHSPCHLVGNGLGRSIMEKLKSRELLSLSENFKPFDG